MSDVYNSQLDAFDLYHLYSEERRSPSTAPGLAIPALGHALAGAVGSAVSNVSVYPLDLIVTRLQSQRQLRKNSSTSLDPDTQYKSIQDAARKIVANEGGVPALYAGVLEDTVKTVADAFLFFLLYNTVRQSRVFKREGSDRLSVISELSVGFVAGAFSKLLTAPIANVVTRLQTSSMADGGRKRAKLTARDVVRQIRAEKGVAGLWSGYSASLILTLNPSLTFFFFETFKRLVFRGSSDKNPKALATFLLAATSKAMASTVTYPFSLAKARIQVSSRSASEPEGDAEKGLGGQKVSAAAARAKKDTVFSTLSQIVRSEGPLALYEGLSGEVIKGFLNHGLTMAAKDFVHSFVISFYFAILRFLKKHPEVQAAVEDAAQKTQDRVQTAVGAAQDGAEAVRHKMEEVGKEANDAVGSVTKTK